MGEVRRRSPGYRRERILLHPLPGSGQRPAGDENYFNRVYFHRLGEGQDRDALIFEKPGERETVFSVEVSDDDLWVVITAFRGSSDKSESLRRAGGAPGTQPVALFTGYRVGVRLHRVRRLDGCCSARTRAHRSAGSSRWIPRTRPRRRVAGRGGDARQALDGRCRTTRSSRRTSTMRATTCACSTLGGAGGTHRAAGHRIAHRHQRLALRRGDVPGVHVVHVCPGEASGTISRPARSSLRQ